MKFKLSFVTLMLLCCALVSYSQLPETIFVKPDRLASVKEKMIAGDATASKWKKNILKEADSYLTIEAPSVMNKNQVPPSGNKHDYMSMAPYYWPDSTKPGFVPYIRKDGQRNPEIKKITDHSQCDVLTKSVQYLALAYYFSGEEKYAVKATQLLNTWFFDPATKMNPNLNYAQAIKGVNDGRGTGLIETISFSNLLNTVGLLDGSKAWTLADKNNLKQWFSDYLTWMLESKNGKDEHKAKNNHGIWYDMQIVAIELYLGKNEMAKEFLQTTYNRIAVQIEPDGKMPLELVRTAALGYNTFCIEAWFKTANMADRLGVDFWNYATTDGRSLKNAFNWLIPYALGDKKWEYLQIHKYSKKQIYAMLLQASAKYKEPIYAASAARLKPTESNTLIEIFYGN